MARVRLGALLAMVVLCACGSTSTTLARSGPRHHAEAHGIWFIGQIGLFLFAPGAACNPWGPGQTIDAVPGGDCA